jgi:hypothetical protein
MVTDKNSNDVSKGKDRLCYDKRKVKALNRELMMIFQKHKESFGHTSAALLSILSYLSDIYLN